MGTEEKVDQNEIARNISFEVEAVPQDNTLMLISTASSTPLKVKVKVRKKNEAQNAQNAVVTVPKFSRSGSKPEKIRLANSDQTILSFNIFTEDEKDPIERPIKKSFIKMFKTGHCFESSADKDDEQYVKSAPKLIRASTRSKSENGLAKNASAESAECANGSGNNFNRGVLGKCKPGGCLDPPFGEDKYSYVLVKRNQVSVQDRHDIKIIDNDTSVNTEIAKTEDRTKTNRKGEISDNSEIPNREQIEHAAIHAVCNDDNIPKNISFEVKTKSQDEALQMTSIADTTIPNNKGDVEKYKDTLARKSSAQERINLASSEQRIMSNVCTKHQDEKKISQTSGALYHFKNMFRSGNSSNKPDEEHQSVVDTTTAFKVENSSTSTERSRSKEKKTKQGVFGKYKPGGCLDPACGQDGNAYELVKTETKAAHGTVTVVTNDYPVNRAVNKTDSKGNNATKIKSDVTQQEPKIQIELHDSASLLSIFQSTKINDSYSSSIITYPPVLTTSEMQINEEKNTKTRNSLSTYRKSFQESQEIYFPKKANTDKKTFNPNGDIISVPSNSNISVTRMNYSYLRAFDATASSSGGQTNVEISLASTSDDLLERALTNFDITVENIRPTYSSVNKSYDKSIDSVKKKLSNEGIRDLNGSVLNNDINQLAIPQKIKPNSNLSSRSSKLKQSKDDVRKNVDIDKTSKHIEGYQSISKVNEGQYDMDMDKSEGVSDKSKHYRHSQSKTRITSHDQEDERTKTIIGDEAKTPEIQKTGMEAPNIRKSSIFLHKSKYVLPEHRDITNLNKFSDFAIIDNTSEPIKNAEAVTDDEDNNDNNNTKRVNPMQSFPNYIADSIQGEEQGSDNQNNFSKDNKDSPIKTSSSFPYQKSREQERAEHGSTNSSIQSENYINGDVDISNFKSPNYSDLHTTQSSSKPSSGEKADSKSLTLMNRFNIHSQTNSLKEIGVAHNEGSKFYGKMYDEMEASEKVPQEIPIYHSEKLQDDTIEKTGDEMYDFPRTTPFDINSDISSIKLENQYDELNNLNDNFTGNPPLQNTFTTGVQHSTIQFVEKDDTIEGLVKYQHQIERDEPLALERENNDLNNTVIPSKTSLKAFIKSDTNISIKSKYSKEKSQGSIHLDSVEISLNSKVQALTQKDLDNVNSQYNTPKEFADLDDYHDPKNQPTQKYFDNEEHKAPSVYQKESNDFNHSKGFPISTEQQQYFDFSPIQNDHNSKDLGNEEFPVIQKEQLETSDYSQIHNEYKRGSTDLNNEEFPVVPKDQPVRSDYSQIQNEYKPGSRYLYNEEFPVIPKEKLERSDSQIQNLYKSGSRDLYNEEFLTIPKEQRERSDNSQIRNEYQRGSRVLDNEGFPAIPKDQPERSDYSHFQSVHKPSSRDLDNEEFQAIPKEQLERSDYSQIQNEYKRDSIDINNEGFPAIPKDQPERSEYSHFQSVHKPSSRDLYNEEFLAIPKEQLERSDYSQIQNEYKRDSIDIDNEEFPAILKEQLERSDYSQIQNVYKTGSRDLYNEEFLVIPKEQLERSDYSQIRNEYNRDSRVLENEEFPAIPKDQPERSDYSQIHNVYEPSSRDLDNEKFLAIPKEHLERSDYSRIQNEYKRGSRNLDNEEFPAMPKEQLERSNYSQIQNMFKSGSRDPYDEEFLVIPKEQLDRSDYSQIRNEYEHGLRVLDNEELSEIPKGQLETAEYPQIQNDQEHGGSRYFENDQFSQTPKEQLERSKYQQIQNYYIHDSKDFDNEMFSLIARDQQEKSDYSQSSIKSKYSHKVGDTDVVKEQQFINPADYLKESNESHSMESSKPSKRQRTKSKVIDDNIITSYSPVTSSLKTNVSKESSDNIKPSFLIPPSDTNKALDTSSPFTKVYRDILDDESGYNLDFQGNRGYKKKSNSSVNEKYFDELKSVNATDSRYLGGDSKEAPKIQIESRQESYSRKTPVSDKQTILDDNDVIVVDIALQRFLNKQGERILKSVDPATISDRDDRIVTIKSTIQLGKSIITPIDKENHLTLTLSKRQTDTVIPVIHDELRASCGNHLKSTFQQIQPRIETGKLQNEAKKTSRNSQCSGLQGPASVVTVPQRTLSAVYELELMPLQKVIKNLKDEIDQLAKQQELFRQRLNNKRLKIARVTNFGKTCGGCMKKTF